MLDRKTTVYQLSLPGKRPVQIKRLRSVFILRLFYCVNCLQKTVWKFYYSSVVRTISKVSGRAKHTTSSRPETISPSMMCGNQIVWSDTTKDWHKKTFIIAESYAKRYSSCDTFQGYSLSSWPFLFHVGSCLRTRDTPAIDQLSPSPTQQTYSAWNQHISGRFFLDSWIYFIYRP